MGNQDDILRTFERWKAANPDSQPTMPYRRILFEERLHNAGIEDNFEFYMYIFNCQYISEYWIKYDKGDWFQAKRRDITIPLTMYAVMNHLEGKCHISRALPENINLFAIDLDYQGSRNELITRFRGITDILPNPVVFQSSRSKGLHLYWFFKSPRYMENVSLRLRSLLDTKDIKLEKGKYETFPGTCHNLRLPLGRDNFLLDNQTLKPLNLNFHDSIEFIRTYIGNGEILFLIENDNPLKPKNTNSGFTYDSIRRTNTIVNMKSLTSGIVAEPIEEYGTRNSRQLQLIRLYANEGHTEDEVFELVMQWYRSHSHKSKDWEQNPQRVEKEVRSATHNWFSKMHCRQFNITGTLTIDEIVFIIERTIQQRPFANIGREDFQLQKFIFYLFLFFKSKHSCKLDLPFNIIKKIPGASSRTAAKFIQACIDIGLMEISSEHNRFLHKNRIYLLHFTFHDGDGVTSFEEGLLRIYSHSDLYRMFKRSTYERIIGYKPHAET